MALEIGPPASSSHPQDSPKEKEHAEKWGSEKGSTGWYIKENKVLIPEAHQCKLSELT